MFYRIRYEFLVFAESRNTDLTNTQTIVFSKPRPQGSTPGPTSNLLLIIWMPKRKTNHTYFTIVKTNKVKASQSKKSAVSC
jgi:hypothetical protein